jgi:anti-anti-sigma factor
MKHEVRYDGDVTLLVLDGIIETVNLPVLSREAERLLQGGTRHLCINARALTFANSTAISFLVELQRRLRELEGELVFSEPSAFFATTIGNLGLQELFRLFDSDSEAVAYFDAPAD